MYNWRYSKITPTAQKVKFSIKDFFSKRDQLRKKLRILSHLLKKSLMENFIFCAVSAALDYNETNVSRAKVSVKISGESPFLILYSSVVKACIFLWCIETESSLVSNPS